MLTFTRSLILVSLINVLVQGEIQNLNVRKMDQSLIAKTRQDTLDLCRIFTEENAKIQHTKPKIIPSNYFRQSHNRRHKREVETKYSVNPALNAEDVKRVEKIVEKLYDDLEERGQKVTYRTNSIPTTTTTKPKNESKSVPKRRFFFAPKRLLGPVPAPHEPVIIKPKQTTFYEKARWKHGIIPYFIDSKTYDAQLQDLITGAFDYIEKATCIRLQKLRERPTDKKSLQDVDWVYITNPTGVRQCVHSNEKRKVNGVQMSRNNAISGYFATNNARSTSMNSSLHALAVARQFNANSLLRMSVLGYDCLSIGDIVHEVMHILGFSHEHTRSDRDQHISILWDNIKPGYRKYFEIAKAADQYTLENLPYDYASVLHYPSRAFSKNGQHTILTEPGIKIGQREGLSEIDVEKVGTIYSSECVERNRDYLIKTCPSVVKSEVKPVNITQKEIEDYFKDRLWPFGIIDYKLRDQMEFSTEEKENIKAVIWHIEKETCIQFKDVTEEKIEVSSHEDPHADHRLTDDESYTAKPEQFGADKLPDIIETNPVIPRGGKKKLTYEELSKNVSDNEIKNVEEKEDDAVPNSARKNIANTNQSKVESKSKTQRVRRQVKSEPESARRHASVLVLTRSALPGCKCPKPGKPSSKANMVLEINADCFNSVNDLLHLFVHVLGLDHQHNMYDRDSYLHIIWDNLTPDIKKELKEKLPPAASVGFPYDYQSVMHYPWLQIKNGVTNLMYPVWNDGWAMGHWQGLSSFDVQKLNLLYFGQCTDRQKQSQTF